MISGAAAEVAFELFAHERICQLGILVTLNQRQRRHDHSGCAEAALERVMLTEGGLQWSVFNIGDSRVYGLVDGVLEQLTRDHSVVQQLVDAGSITRDEADIHPHANVITRAVGLMEAPVPEFSTFPLVPASRVLLCSDGLTKEITDVGIEHFLVSTATAEETAHELLKNALGNSGRDNITVIVIDVLAVTPPGQTG